MGRGSRDAMGALLCESVDLIWYGAERRVKCVCQWVSFLRAVHCGEEVLL